MAAALSWKVCQIVVLACIASCGAIQTDNEHVSLPFSTLALAKSHHYIPSYNPSYDQVNPYCTDESLRLEITNWVEYFDGKSGANFYDLREMCSLSDRKHIDIDSTHFSGEPSRQLPPLVKIRLGEVDAPETGYDQSTTECLHLFKLEEISSSLKLSGAAGMGAAGRYGAPRFPRGIYLNNNYFPPSAHASAQPASVCISEFVSGIPLAVHVAQMSSVAEVAEFALAAIEMVATLARNLIIHRDIYPSNMVVTQTAAAVGGGDSRPRLALLDWTWALSPHIKPLAGAIVMSKEEVLKADGNVSAPLYTPINPCYSRSGAGNSTGRLSCADGEAPCNQQVHEVDDLLSMGLVLKDVLSMYCELDTDWLNPVLRRMVARRPVRSSWTQALPATDFEGLKAEVIALARVEEAEAAAMRAAAASKPPLDPVEARRQQLCNQPNALADEPGLEVLTAHQLDGSGAPLDPPVVAPFARVVGYQHFDIRKDFGRPDIFFLTPNSAGLQRKETLVGAVLEHISQGLSVFDIGGNFGYFCAKAIQYGATEAHLIDMDTRYTDLARDMYAHLGPPLTRIGVHNTRLKDLAADPAAPQSADIVIALALIHWSYNCSETRGSLAKTIGTLAVRARKVLIIEWIDPTDMVIQMENHLGVGHEELGGTNASTGAGASGIDGFESSPYSLAEFRRVLMRIFGCVSELGAVSPTRRLFLAMRVTGRHYAEKIVGDAVSDIVGSKYDRLTAFIKQNVVGECNC